jgi:hypothetical protein
VEQYACHRGQASISRARLIILQPYKPCRLRRSIYVSCCPWLWRPAGCKAAVKTGCDIYKALSSETPPNFWPRDLRGKHHLQIWHKLSSVLLACIAVPAEQRASLVGVAYVELHTRDYCFLHGCSSRQSTGRRRWASSMWRWRATRRPWRTGSVRGGRTCRSGAHQIQACASKRVVLILGLPRQRLWRVWRIGDWAMCLLNAILWRSSRGVCTAARCTHRPAAAWQGSSSQPGIFGSFAGGLRGRRRLRAWASRRPTARQSC